MLHDPQANLNAEGVYELSKAAGLGEQAAAEASRQRGLARLRAELPP